MLFVCAISSMAIVLYQPSMTISLSVTVAKSLTNIFPCFVMSREKIPYIIAVFDINVINLFAKCQRTV